MPSRSYLYVPGDAPDKLSKAFDRGADALIADLEDAVPGASKDAARRTVRDWLDGLTPEQLADVWVRVNPDEELEEDLRAVVRDGLAGIIVPKTAPQLLLRVNDLLEAIEAERSIERQVPVTPLIESAAGLAQIDRVAAHGRVHHLAMGEADLTSELAIERSSGDPELLPLRMRVVLASAAAGLPPPVGSTSTDFDDLGALRRSTEGLRRLGFRGRSAIHPAQLEVINDVFTPSDEEVVRAQDVVDRYEAALEAGRGVATDEDGRMIDEAVVRRSRDILAFADND